LLGAHPGDPRLLAYAGAATARLSRTTLLPWKKMRHAEDGLAQLDKALALIRPEHEQAPAGGVPPALETRLVAANTFLAVPGMFNRGARGEKLLAELLNLPTLATAPAAFRSAVFFLAVSLWRRTVARALRWGNFKVVHAALLLRQRVRFGGVNSGFAQKQFLERGAASHNRRHALAHLAQRALSKEKSCPAQTPIRRQRSVRCRACSS
jgi:hypothetical protein